MISWRMAAAWLLALVLTTVLTWQIVGLADSQVGDEAPVAVAPLSTTTSSGSSSSSSTAITSTTIAATTTTAEGSAGSSPGTSSGTSPGSTSSVTTAETEWSVRTINSAGGSVVIRYRPGEVEYQAATPAAGFGVEVDDTGPDRVRVEFESEDNDVRVEVRWENGELDIDVD